MSEARRSTPITEDLTAVVARVLYPWFEEMQGAKFAAHDSVRCAAHVVAALNALDHRDKESN